ncbi:MAG TPA: hypothetical protein ENK84_12400 [Desulfobulbus sp.]|nr:hypothetical protein [Desulfobulbus sp.]HHD64651.1 hypothetical protein [Desulfobulbaceae bacterium]
MTLDKQPIYPHLVRQVPEQFSWIDHRLVRERYIDRISRDAAALYLFLVTVSDARGLSYYGDTTIQSRLNMSECELSAARLCLVEQQLIAWRSPLYQMLPLEHRREEPAVRVNGGPRSMQEILQQIVGGTK